MSFLKVRKIVSLEIYMDFDDASGYGKAQFKPKFFNPLPEIKNDLLYFFYLSCLMYGRILWMDMHMKERLIHTVQRTAEEMCKCNHNFDFDKWYIDGNGEDKPIWPWIVDHRDKLLNPQIYKPTLIGSSLSKLNLFFNPPVYWHKILIPSSVLLAIFFTGRLATEDTELKQLGKWLLEINNCYHFSNNIRPVKSRNLAKTMIKEIAHDYVR